MRQLSLDDVVRAGQEGTEWKQAQERVKRQQQAEQREQASMEAGSAAFKSAMDEDMQQHIQSGGKAADYKPSTSTMLRSVEARSAAFAKIGDWGNFVKNEGAAEGQRMRVRAQAVQQFDGDKDFPSFLKRVYETIPDGSRVTGIEELQGGPADAPKGAPSGPTKYRVKLSNGESRMVDPDTFYKDAQRMLADPARTAEEMVKHNYLTARTKAEKEGQIAVEKEKGNQARLTEAAKQPGRVEVVEGRNEGAKERTRMTLESAETRADAANRTRVQAAGISASGRGGGGGGGSGGGGKGGATKEWQQATKDVENARKVYRDESKRAYDTKVNGNLRLMRASEDEKNALVERDEGVKRSKDKLLEAESRAKRLADKAEGVKGDAAPAGNRIRMDAQGNVVR